MNVEPSNRIARSKTWLVISFIKERERGAINVCFLKVVNLYFYLLKVLRYFLLAIRGGFIGGFYVNFPVD